MEDILSKWIDPSDLDGVQELHAGLINDTWIVKTKKSEQFILQRVNTTVFTTPESIDANYQCLLSYLCTACKQCNPTDVIIPRLIPTISESTLLFHLSNCYRMTEYITNSSTISNVESSAQAFEAAKQFGRFARIFAPLPVENLHITLADFHNLPLRYQQFLDSIQRGMPDRINAHQELIARILAHGNIVETFQRLIPDLTIRTTHHDTKISNVLFHASTRQALCVIDLDTVMPGYFLSDLGDMFRSQLSPVDENCADLDQIVIRMDIFRAILEGYLSQMHTVLSPTEISQDTVYFAGLYMIYMQTLRFAADFFRGDVYYKISYATHNLVRCTNQLTLLDRYFAKSAEMMACVEEVVTKLGGK